ncbi:hypothetical protein SAMN06295912_102279 [Sphingomonas laterariae]|uniref:Uncharacterized protein n=1 Tax=Edaphosphingomonas laterariae TaxID=861865 RepID=A0A239CND5_9SPHN|nr:hypothetical protein [Sphingomonas laterariae]SNS21004.1 hypothetical protein SAMN06295912_102279 [Sphingomonas laterariae]
MSPANQGRPQPPVEGIWRALAIVVTLIALPFFLAATAAKAKRGR